MMSLMRGAADLLGLLLFFVVMYFALIAFT